MIPNSKTIAIIGGGPSGLVSCKTALECQLVPTVFEKNSDFGGNWAPNTTKAWNSMKTNVSKYSCSFSDFPHPFSNDTNKEELFLTQPQVYDYLYNYAKKFDVLKYIKTNCNVTKVSRVILDDIDKWKVEWLETIGTETFAHEIIFDFVIISSGINSKPAKFKQLELLSSSFSGRIIHSREFKSPESYKDKRVLVIGSAFSGSQIACDVSSVAKSVHQMIRRDNQWVLTTQLSLDIDKDKEIKAPIDFFFYNRKQTYDYISLPPIEYHQYLNKSIKALSKNNYDCVHFEYNEREYNQPPYFIITNDEYISLVENGDIKLIRNSTISNVNGNLITFKSNKNQNESQEIQLEFDEVIISTGYQTDLTFLDKEVLDEINYIPDDYYVSCLLHKNVFPSKFKNIAFSGIINTPFFMTLEMMSRWCCYVFAGIIQYPTQEKIHNGIKDQLEIRNKDYINRYQFPYINVVAHLDDLAKEIGVLPDFDEIKCKDPEFYEELWSSFFCSASFRLTGPFCSDNAKEIINQYSNISRNLLLPKLKQ